MGITLRAERSRTIIPSSAESDDRLTSDSGFFYAIETLFPTPPGLWQKASAGLSYST